MYTIITCTRRDLLRGGTFKTAEVYDSSIEVALRRALEKGAAENLVEVRATRVDHFDQDVRG